MSWFDKLMKSVAGRIAELSPSCREAARLQSMALDSALTLRQRLGLRIHLLLCKWCRSYGKQIRFLRDAAHRHPDEMMEAAPATLSDEARARIKKTLQAEGE
jgi:hypothetical protein